MRFSRTERGLLALWLSLLLLTLVLLQIRNFYGLYVVVVAAAVLVGVTWWGSEEFPESDYQALVALIRRRRAERKALR